MNVVMTGAGRFVEVQGTGETRHVRARPSCARCCARARRHPRASSRRSAACSATPGCCRARRAPRSRRRRVKFVVATFNRDKAARARARCSALPGVELVRARATCPARRRPRRPARRCSRTRASRRARRAALTGLPAIADDTGLEVDALGGAPGVHAARFAGPGRDLRRQRARSCSRELRGVPRRAAHGALPHRVRRVPRRTAARSWPRACSRAASPRRRAARTASATTRCSRSRALGRTLAELTPSEKNAISHRARATRNLLARWDALPARRCNVRLPPRSRRRCRVWAAWTLAAVVTAALIVVRSCG